MSTDCYCYILRHTNPTTNKTYIGYTTNPARRIRQHNGELVGGAKYTTAQAGTVPEGKQPWEFMALIKGLPDKVNAQQCEWRLKHPNNKRKSNRKYSGKEGRIKALLHVLTLEQWTRKSTILNNTMSLEVHILNQYEHLIKDLPDNITIQKVDHITPF